MATNVPREIMNKYPYKSRMKDPDNSSSKWHLIAEDAVFVPDHNSERYYWKGVERVRWATGRREYRWMYWTKPKGLGRGKWRYGQSPAIMSAAEITRIVRMMKAKRWIRASI